MSTFAQMANANAAGETFLLRWKGKQEGPYKISIIEARLQANEIGLLHEIFHDGRWMTIRDFFAAGQAQLRAEQMAAQLAEEERNRRLRELAEKKQTSDGAEAPARYDDDQANTPEENRPASQFIKYALLSLVFLASVGLCSWIIFSIGHKGGSPVQGGSPVHPVSGDPKTAATQGESRRASDADIAKNATLARIQSLESDYQTCSSELLKKQDEQTEYNGEVQAYFMDHKMACLALGFGLSGVGVLVAQDKNTSNGANAAAGFAAGLGAAWVIQHPDEAKEVGDQIVQATARQQDYAKQVSILQTRVNATANQLKQERAKLGL